MPMSNTSNASVHNNDTTSSSSANGNMFGKKAPKSAAVFFSQIIVIYIVVITSIINLSIQDCTKPGVCNLWIAMLSSALGYLLPSPSLRITRINNGSIGEASTTTTTTSTTGSLLDTIDGTTEAHSLTSRTASSDDRLIRAALKPATSNASTFS